jgi:hypothetical protein
MLRGAFKVRAQSGLCCSGGRAVNTCSRCDVVLLDSSTSSTRTLQIAPVMIQHEREYV